MDLKTKKLDLIEYLLHITDEQIFDKIESVIKTVAKERNIEDPFTEEEMIERAKKSNEDYVAGRVMTIDQLKAAVKNW